jgi:glutamine synthetase
MAKYTKEDIYKLIEEEDVSFIRLQFTNMFGELKNMAVTVRQLDKVLNNQCSFDGSLIEGFTGIEESILYLYPDIDTFQIFPWRPQNGKVARFLCDVCCADGRAFQGDPRQILKNELKEIEELGYSFDIGPECEFFLFDLDTDGNPTNNTAEKGKYFDVGPIDYGENARREMVFTLEEVGIDCESSYHENAPGQHEIDFRYKDALTTADNIVTFKMAVKTVARRHGLHATFMPKPKEGVDGSGMHINMSLSKEGRNIFYDPSAPNGISEDGMHFIAGILKHVEGMAVLTNPLVNSYKRLTLGYDAPVYIAWSITNRSPLLTISDAGKPSVRVELRSPDPCANPYLTFAACLRAGMDGIKNKLEAPEIVNRNIYEMSAAECRSLGIRTLPRTLAEAVEAFKKDEIIKNVLGDHISERYIEAKQKEWEEYNNKISPWEMETYLGRY